MIGLKIPQTQECSTYVKIVLNGNKLQILVEYLHILK